MSSFLVCSSPISCVAGEFANLAIAVPFKAEWLTVVGLMFFFFNIMLFITNCVLISLRFYWRPGSFIASFTDQVESLFIPAFVSLLLTSAK